MWLNVLTGPQAGQSLELVEQDLAIGRGAECGLTLSDPKLSRRHASLKALPDGRAALHDLGSSNGSFVNGYRVPSALLSGGEQIRLGGTLLTVTPERMTGDRAATVHEIPALAAATAPPVGTDAARSDSGVRRLVATQSRRATILGGAALAVAGLTALLFASGVFPVDDGGGNAAGSDDDAGSVEDAVEGAAPSTMLISVSLGGQQVGGGTGWVLDQEQKLVVTNAHVINAGDSYEVGPPDELEDAEVVGVAPCEDLALLRVDDLPEDARSLPLGDQESLRLGQPVVALGFPGSASQENDLTSTTGVISVKETRFREDALDVPNYPNVIQTDAAVNPGNSGGPLITLDGRLAGVNSAGRTLDPSGQRIIQGQSYAIGVDQVKDVLETLRREESIGWVGLSFQYLPPDQLRVLDLPPGIGIQAVVDDSPAEEEDVPTRVVLVGVNGREIGNSLQGYCNAAGDAGSGDDLTLSVVEPGSGRSGDFRVEVP